MNIDPSGGDIDYIVSIETFFFIGTPGIVTYNSPLRQHISGDDRTGRQASADVAERSVSRVQEDVGAVGYVPGKVHHEEVRTESGGSLRRRSRPLPRPHSTVC